MSWNVINKVQTGILRTTDQQSATDAGLLYTAPSYTIHSTGERGGTASVAEVTKMTGLALRRFRLFNSTGSTLTLGIGYRLHNRYWKCGVTDGTTFTDDTADAQDLGTSDVIIGADTATGNTTEFVIFSPIPFNWFSMNIGTAEVDDGADHIDHVMQFSDAAGTGWTTIATTGSYLDNLTLTNTPIPTGAREFAWPGNPAWGRVVSLGGIPAGNYAMRIETADAVAADTAALANTIEVGTMIFKEGVLTNTAWVEELIQFKQHEADAVVAFFSTADPLNTVYAEVTTF